MSDAKLNPNENPEPEQILASLASREQELIELEAELDAYEAELDPELVASLEVPDVFRSEPVAKPVFIRDPAMVELLRQNSALSARLNHMATNMENLHKKFDSFAGESLDWHRRREEWERIQIDTAARSGEAARRDTARLLILAAIFGAILIAWLVLS